MSTSPLKILANTLLGGDVEAFIAGQRAAGLSWRKIASNIRERTGGVIDPTPQTIVNWTRKSEAA